MDQSKLVRMSERDFVVSCIISNKVCQSLLQYVDLSFFETQYARIIMRWIVEYFNDFRSAPGKNILSVYRGKVDEIQDEALQETVLLFLQKLPDTEVQINEDYLVSQGQDFLEYRKTINLVEDLQSCLSVRDMGKARQFIKSYEHVDIIHSQSLRLINKDDARKINDALNKVDDILFDLPTKINEVVGDIHRTDFIALLAGPKAGKTWWLCWMAIQAMLRGRKVIFFSLEMTEEQVLKRMWTLLFGVRSPTIDKGEIIPYTEWKSSGDKMEPVLKSYKVDKNRSFTVNESQKHLKMMSHGGDIQIETYPMNSQSVKNIEQRVREIANLGYIPDVVVIDYADIMLPSGGGSELRNQLDSTWKSLRAFAQEMKIAVFTASQTNRAGLSGQVEADQVAEDMRKLAHVTSFVALQRPPLYRTLGVCGLKNLMARNEVSDKEVVFASGYKLGQFCLGNAYWKDEVNLNLSGSNNNQNNQE